MTVALTVRVLDLNDVPRADVVVEGGPMVEDGLAPGPLEVLDEGRLEVPEDGRLVVRLTRPDAPGLALRVPLDLSRQLSRAFLHRRPNVMRLTALGQGARRAYTLTVRWGEVQEVVFASGTKPAEQFATLAVGRLARLVSSEAVEPSCVLTLFAFRAEREEGQPARFFLEERRFLAEAGRLGSLTVGQLASGRGGALMSKRVYPANAPEVSVLTVYRYLAAIGEATAEDAAGRVREFGIFSHAYWIAPVLLNTGRPPAQHAQRSRVSRHTCHEHCPVEGEHESLRRIRVPLLRDFTPPYGYHARSNVTIRSYPHLVLSKRNPAHRGLGAHRRHPHDRDPRNTDFAGAGMMDVDVAAMRRSLHPEAILRVWGCNNSAIGPLSRTWRANHDEDERNDRLLEVSATWYRHGDPANMLWRVKSGDARLLYASRLRRSYAQALAQALGRPCYGAVTGTYGEYDAAPLGSMVARCMNRMGPKAFELLYPEGVPDDELSEADRREVQDEALLTDAGDYMRFSPTPRPVPVTINVLVTGFLPFRGRDGSFVPYNTAAEVVRELGNLDVQALLNPPSWLSVTLNLVTDPEVDVVWTCPAPKVEDERVPARASAGPSPGGANRILERAEEIEADLVVIVGETASLPQRGCDVRLERFASNLGTDGTADNDRQRLDRDQPGWHHREDFERPILAGPIFPERDVDELLEGTVPLRAWLQCLATLRGALGPERVDNGPGTHLSHSPGQFVCNETYYHCLLESRHGSEALGGGSGRPPSRPATGRWVQMIHVAAQRMREPGPGERSWSEVPELDDVARAGHARLAQALAAAVGSLVDEMTWASDMTGLQVTHEGSTTPEPSRYVPGDWFQLHLVDHNDQPGAGIEVSLTDSAGVEHSATTDERGVARWTGLARGEVSFDLPDGYQAHDEASESEQTQGASS